MSKKPEILAPVGNWEMCKAAVHNGADAIYVGMPGFNARGRTEVFSIESLVEMISFCHLYGTKVFIASNILIFEREISSIQSLLFDLIPYSPDAFIVQDIGLVRLIRAIAPSQVIHASTQMTVSSYEAIEMTADLCMQRYVLARENSIEEIRKIRERTTKELEVFVHGALCVAYSGQCLTSESFGGRSANRGQCAQACRLPYDLIVDGIEKEIPEKRYLVSPQDLFALSDVDRLMDAGVNSFKIEGRLKSPQYVSETVRWYKAKVMDPLVAIDSAEETLSRVYSRGFYNGWLDGVNHQELVQAKYSNHHGVELGSVMKADRRSVVIQLKDSAVSVAPGDGVIFEDFVSGRSIGTSVYEVLRKTNHEVEVSFSRDFEIQKIIAGMVAFTNATPKLMKELERTWTDKEELRKVPLHLVLQGKAGEHLTVTVFDDLKNSCSVDSKAILEPSKNAPFNRDAFKKELGALGSTPFYLSSLEVRIEGDVFIHNKEIKEIRRAFVEKISALRIQRCTLVINDSNSVERWKKETIHSLAPVKVDNSVEPKVNLLIRDPKQLIELAGLPINTIFLDYEFGKDYGPSVVEVRTLGYQVGIATTRILKPGEIGHLKVIQRLKPDAILVRNLGALYYLQDKGLQLHGDFSLNVTNSLSAAWFLEKGLSTLCPSYDLNSEQLEDLLGSIDGRYFEVTVHQYMPAFHMEHCVFAAFLSNGTSFRDCGKPCEKHRVELRDKTGALHPLKADAECRNTMFNGNAQSAARLIPNLRKMQVGSFRIEALFETPAELRDKIECYLDLLYGKSMNKETFNRLRAVERYGVTEGQLFNIKTFEDRRKGA